MVEFLGVSLLLLVPLVYLVVAMAQVQAGSFAAEIAAREAARAAVVGGVAALEDGATLNSALAAGARRADAVTALTVEDFGLGHDAAEVRLACSSTPCFRPGSDITAEVTIEVTLPGVPAMVAEWMPLSVTVSSTSTSAVDGFASGS